MDITVPDLDELEFVARCARCMGNGTFTEYVDNGKGARPRHTEKTKPCQQCGKSGVQLTNVGERLIEFLKAVGVVIPQPDGYRTLRPLGVTAPLPDESE